MNDQAQALRTRAGRPGEATPSAPKPVPGETAAVVVLAGGKGGVGTSTLTVLAGAALAHTGRRVLLVDGAQNQGALHLLLGVKPRHTLAELAAGEASIGALPTPVADGLALVAADAGSRQLYALSHTDRARLHLRVTALFDDYDVVLVDSGAGLESAVRAGAMRARLLVAVTTPDPIALSLTHALVKTVKTQLPSLPVGAFVQQAAAPHDAELALAKLHEAARRFLDFDLPSVGALPFTDALRHGSATAGGLLHAGETADVAAALAPLVATCTGGSHVG